MNSHVAQSRLHTLYASPVPKSNDICRTCADPNNDLHHRGHIQSNIRQFLADSLEEARIFMIFESGSSNLCGEDLSVGTANAHCFAEVVCTNDFSTWYSRPRSWKDLPGKSSQEARLQEADRPASASASSTQP